MKRKSIFIALILCALVLMSSTGRVGASVERTEEITVAAAIDPVYRVIARSENSCRQSSLTNGQYRSGD